MSDAVCTRKMIRMTVVINVYLCLLVCKILHQNLVAFLNIVINIYLFDFHALLPID